jgi:hypothetical protein
MSGMPNRRVERDALRSGYNHMRCNAHARRRLIWVLAFAISALLAGCQNVSTAELLAGSSIKLPLRITPAEASVTVTQSVLFSVTGGNPPYTFKVFSGNGSVSGSTYTAPNSIGSAVVTVSDSGGTSLASLITIVANANCPANYIPVSFNNAVGTTADFCVSKYEMKCGNVNGTGCSGSPMSLAANQPWISINQTDAKTACATLGGQYHLITNAEWMTIARSIEATATNWSTGTVNSGSINRGHTDNSPASTLAASTDDDACSGTGQSCASFNDQRRTHVLANGQTIWDFSGNAKELIDWQLVTDRAGAPAGAYVELNTQTITTSMPANSFKSNTTALNSANGIGMYWPDTNGNNGYAARGGHYGNGSGQAGIYHLDFGQNAGYTSTQFGFRCAYQ